MKHSAWLFLVPVLYGATLGVLTTPQVVQAQWHAIVGEQTSDKARQAIAFLPNELWIHAGDSINWTHNSDDAHTVTFLTADQVRPLDPEIPPSAGASFDGSTPVNSGLLLTVGEKYTVTFPTAGNFKLVCLVHANMTAAIHVLGTSETLPHDQEFYDDQANHERTDLLLDRDRKAEDEQTDSRKNVTVGGGEIVATGGGSQALSVVRFLPGTTVVHVGETIEWTNSDPGNLHTVTFGPDPTTPAPFPVKVNANLDSDGALHAIIDSLASDETVHSGILQALPQDRAVVIIPPAVTDDLVQFPLPAHLVDVNQRFRVTFTRPGVFTYHCVFHDNLGMVGKVVVKP